MTIIASCGCKVADVSDTFSVRFGEETCDAIDGFAPCVVYAEYCRICAAKVETWPECIRSDEEADLWLDGKHPAQLVRCLARRWGMGEAWCACPLDWDACPAEGCPRRLAIMAHTRAEAARLYGELDERLSPLPLKDEP